MKRTITLTLNQASIEDALKSYVAEMGISLQGAQVDISLTAGRGVNGHSADITISRGENAVVPSQPVKRSFSKSEYLDEEEVQETETTSSKTTEIEVPALAEEEEEDSLEIQEEESVPVSGKSIFG